MTLSLSSGTDPRCIIAPTSFRISKQCCGPATRPGLGWPDCVEYGPGKHALGHSYYVYLLDPDGHRVELLLPPIVYMDRDDAPAISDVTQITRVTECWGLPPQNSCFSTDRHFQDGRSQTLLTPTNCYLSKNTFTSLHDLKARGLARTTISSARNPRSATRFNMMPLRPR